MTFWRGIHVVKDISSATVFFHHEVAMFAILLHFRPLKTVCADPPSPVRVGITFVSCVSLVGINKIDAFKNYSKFLPSERLFYPQSMTP
jgi:hypothetical protein